MEGRKEQDFYEVCIRMDKEEQRMVEELRVLLGYKHYKLPKARVLRIALRELYEKVVGEGKERAG